MTTTTNKPSIPGLAVAMWALGVQAVITLVRALATTYLSERARDGSLSFGQTEQAWESLMRVFEVTAVAELAAVIAVIVGIAVVMASPRAHAVRVWLGVAITGQLALATAFGADILASLELFSFGDTSRWLWRVASVGTIASFTALVVALRGLARADDTRTSPGLQVAAIALAALAWGAPTVVFWSGPPELVTDHWVAYRAIATALALAAYACMIALLHAGARGGAASGESAEGWHRAARGLDLFTSAVTARVWLAFGGVVLVVLVVAARSLAGAKLVAFLIPLASAGTALAMLIGLIGFRAVPRPDGARGAATASVVMFSVLLALELWGAVRILGLLFGDGLRGLMSSEAESWIYVNVGGQLFVAIGFLCAIAAMTRIARALDAVELAARCAGLQGLVAAVFAGAGILRYATLRGELVDTPQGAAVVMIAAAVAVIVAILVFVGVARQVAERMREGAAAMPPPARVVKS